MMMFTLFGCYILSICVGTIQLSAYQRPYCVLDTRNGNKLNVASILNFILPPTLQDLLVINIMAKTKNEMNGVLVYLNGFVYVLILTVQYKVLAQIDIYHNVSQREILGWVFGRHLNIETLLEDLMKL